MSKSSLIKEIILDTLKDGEIHTTKEIRDICSKQGIIDDPKASIIRAVLPSLKKEYPNFITLSRGKYKMLTGSSSSNVENSYKLSESIAYIEKKAEELKAFNWITCTDDELHVARQQVSIIKDFLNRMNKIIP